MGLIREQIVKRFTRSRGWGRVRREFLKESPNCAVCDRDRGREVHHIRDFSTHPELELDVENLITLCRDHHLLFGHLMSWKSINPDVEVDGIYFRRKIQARR